MTVHDVRPVLGSLDEVFKGVVERNERKIA